MAIVRISDSHDKEMANTEEFEISKETWDKIVYGLKAKNFWSYFTTNNKRVLDGASWSLEAYKPVRDECTLKRYHRVGQSSSGDTVIVAMCNLFLELKDY